MTFDTAWARCAGWLQDALDAGGGTHALEDVRAMVEQGEARLWAGLSSAMVTEVHNFPRQRVLHFWLAGGDLEELTAMLRPAAEAWARARGCTAATILGRPGWERVLAPAGYAPVARLVRKELKQDEPEAERVHVQGKDLDHQLLQQPVEARRP